MKEIKLTRGKVTQVDAEDFLELSRYKWHLSTGRGQRQYATRKKLGGRVYMHCEIMGSKGIDHIDGDGLNNQRENLRVADQTQNLGNARKRAGHTTSKYKGVSRCSQTGKWIARVYFRGSVHYLGRFTTERLAAEAYNKRAARVFGEFARLNEFP